MRRRVKVGGVMAALICLAAFAGTADAETGIGGDIEARAAAVARQATAPANGRKPTRAELERRPQVLRKTGGFIDVEAVGVSVVAIDGRAGSTGAVGQFAEVFGRLSKTNVRTRRRPLATVAEAAEAARGALADERAVYALVVVDDPAGRGLSVYPEERVAVVNGAKYGEGDDPVRREVRIVKELWRGLGFVAGVGYAPFGNDVLQPVFSVGELDGLEYQVMQPMNFQKMYATLGRFGVRRARRIPYRTAVHEGWAPAPTNDYQKAVWDEVRAPPRNPMKIEFDPKKGR
ncbi:MAG: hypothetical protein ACI4RA_10575 [Kiritimatiellia bacterium]